MDRYGLICRSFYENPDVTQRELASILNLSLGTVNKLAWGLPGGGISHDGYGYGEISADQNRGLSIWNNLKWMAPSLPPPGLAPGLCR